MANYVVTTDFAAKDALATGNPLKVASGTQVDAELDNIATAIATKEDTANKGINSGYASLDGSGDVPDGQLPANIVRSDAATTTITGNVVHSGAAPRIVIAETGVTANNTRYDITADVEQLKLRLINDADNSFQNVMVLDRTAQVADTLAWTVTTMTINGNTVWHAGNDGSGSGLDADLLDGNSSAFFLDAGNFNAGVLANARVAVGNVTQHQASLAIACSQLTGNMPDARIIASNVTQHQASITINASQVTAGTMVIGRGGTGTTDGTTRNVTGKAGVAKTLSTSAASGGSDGDIWYRY